MMVACRIFSAALAIWLFTVVVKDIMENRRQPAPVLVYEKGIYLGKQEPALSEEVRATIRARSGQAADW